MTDVFALDENDQDRWEHETMDAATPLNELAAALAKAQGAMSNAVMDKVNPHFKSKYASLAAIWDVARKPLSDNGLAVAQIIREDTLYTMLLHTSGQSLTSEYSLPTTGRPQEIGSALTYARRYSLSALVGITADEDDDANAANGTKRENPHVTRASDITDIPAADDPDRIPTPQVPVKELPKMQQRDAGEKLSKELNACKTLAEVEEWKNLETTSYRLWQLREMWREAMQGRVKGRLMELRGAASQAAFEHERSAQELERYETP